MEPVKPMNPNSLRACLDRWVRQPTDLNWDILNMAFARHFYGYMKRNPNWVRLLDGGHRPSPSASGEPEANPVLLETLNHVLARIYSAHGRSDRESVRRDALLAWIEQWPDAKLKNWVNLAITSFFREKARKEEPFFAYLLQKAQRELEKMAATKQIRTWKDGKSRLFGPPDAGPTKPAKDLSDSARLGIQKLLSDSHSRGMKPLEADLQPFLACILLDKGHRDLHWSASRLTQALIAVMEIPHRFTISFDDLASPNAEESESRTDLPAVQEAYVAAPSQIDAEFTEPSEPGKKRTLEAELDHPDLQDWAVCVGSELLGMDEERTPKQKALGFERALGGILFMAREFPATGPVIGIPSAWTKAMAKGVNKYETMAEVMKKILSQGGATALKSFVEATAVNRSKAFLDFFKEKYHDWLADFEDRDDFPVENALLSLLRFLYRQLPDTWREANV